MKLNKIIITLSFAAAAIAAPIAIEAADAWAPFEQTQDVPQVKVQPSSITIEIPGDQAMHVVIYALTGQAVKQFYANPGSNYVELPAGYYIVRVGHYSVRVAVK